MVTAQGKKPKNKDTAPYSATIFHYDNVEALSSLSPLCRGTETIGTPGPILKALHNMTHIPRGSYPTEGALTLESKSRNNHSLCSYHL